MSEIEKERKACLATGLVDHRDEPTIIDPSIAKDEGNQQEVFTSQKINIRELCESRAKDVCKGNEKELEAALKKNSKEEEALIASIVNEMNRSHAIIHTNTTHILIEKSGSDFVLDSKQSLLNLYENDTVLIAGKPFSKAQIWLKSPNRRTFQNIVFNPRINGHSDGNFNIWKGFSVTPRQGNCQLFWRHVRDVICSGKEVHYQYVRKWLAHLIQKPWVVATALVLRGKQGTGKGTFVEAVGRLLGSHYGALASLDKILGRFNSHLKNVVLIYADEAIWGGNKKEVGMLKALITEPKLFIEGKGKDGYWIDNFKHLIVSSNEDWAVHIDPDDRRFFVLDVSSHCQGDTAYFNALHAELENGGHEALMHDLITEDITGFDPRIMPENFTGFDMKMESASSIDRYLFISLKEGCWDHANSSPSQGLEDVSRDKFYENYKNWCEYENQAMLRKETVGRRLKQILSSLGTKRPSSEENKRRPIFYVFPPLSECRAAFEKFYKQNAEIWEES